VSPAHNTHDAGAATDLVYLCFVDYEKVFDWIDWVKLLDILCNMGVNWRDQSLIWNLYMG